MNKTDLFSIFLCIVFAFIIVLVTVAVATQVWTTYLIKSDVPLYSRPTWTTEATTTTMITTTEETETTAEPRDTGAGLYGED